MLAFLLSLIFEVLLFCLLLLRPSSRQESCSRGIHTMLRSVPAMCRIFFGLRCRLGLFGSAAVATCNSFPFESGRYCSLEYAEEIRYLYLVRTVSTVPLSSELFFFFHKKKKKSCKKESRITHIIRASNRFIELTTDENSYARFAGFRSTECAL